MRSWEVLARRVTTRWDVTLTLFLVTIAVVETVSATSAPRPGLRAVLAGATVLGLAFRRKLPVTTAAWVSFGLVAESLVLEPPDEMGVLLAVVVAAFSVAAYSPLREGLLGAGLLSMAIAVAIARDPSDSVSNILPTLLLFVVVPGGLGVTVHRRQRDLSVLRLEADVLAGEADAAVEAERRRIARELHDVVSHAVTLIAVQAEAGQAVIDRDVEAARRALSAIGEASRDALMELDGLLGLLRDDGSEPVEDDLGLERMAALLAGARSTGLTVELHEQGVRRTLPPLTDHCAFRVVQEGLTNALRHAPGSTVRIRVDYTDQDVRISVDSAGRRHGTSYGGTGRGLVGLKERVLGLGGTLDAAAAENGDFGLHAVLPAAAS